MKIQKISRHRSRSPKYEELCCFIAECGHEMYNDL